MAYRLTPGPAIDSELRRVAARQFDLALGYAAGSHRRPHDAGLRQCRRHIEKIRALAQLARPALGPAHRDAPRRLGKARRLLAPIANTAAVVDAFDRLCDTYREELPSGARFVRTRLQQRTGRIDGSPAHDKVRKTVARLLRAERSRSRDWRFGNGHEVLAAGITRARRRARRAMLTASDEPTPANYHTWRRRVKILWLQIRLIQQLCDGKLADYERDLRALNRCLGEYCDAARLEQAFTTAALAVPAHATAWRQLIRAQQQQLGKEAQALAARVHADSPRQFIRRLRRLWRHSAPAARSGRTSHASARVA